MTLLPANDARRAWFFCLGITFRRRKGGMIFYCIERPHGSLAGLTSLEIPHVLLRSSTQPVAIFGDS